MENILSKRESNKAVKKALFIDAAEKLFIQNGFENTSIDEVAKEAGLTKRTLYQYFVNKEDLFFAVALKGAWKLTTAYEEALGGGDTALEKIQLANQAYLQFYTDYLGLFRILNYQPANQENCAASPNYRELEMISGIRMKHFMDLMGRAKADGSINPNLDKKKAVFFAFFTAFSLLFTASSTDKSMWKIMELDENEFIRFCFDLLIGALK